MDGRFSWAAPYRGREPNRIYYGKSTAKGVPIAEGKTGVDGWIFTLKFSLHFEIRSFLNRTEVMFREFDARACY